MNFSVITLGCKVNKYESQVMSDAMLCAGFTLEHDYKNADIVIVNSCTVTAVSDSKALKLMRRVKRENPHSITVLTGCMPQAFPDELKNFDSADIIMGNKCRNDLIPLIKEYIREPHRIVKIEPHQDDVKFEQMQVSTFDERTRAFVKIEDGCNRFCSYCIIPYARGRVRSKPLEDIKAELKILADKGYREVVLVGINLSAYGNDLGGINLADAIECACSVDGIRRVRLGSLEPERMDEDTIKRLAKQEKLCPQFHLSLQSGCDGTLRRMNRHYNTEEYMHIVENLRKYFDNCAITTDVMVGFPGEDDKEFAASLDFVKRVGFAKVHTFAYSRRPGTVADRAQNQVQKSDKDKRSKLMIEESEKLHQAFLRSQLGKTESVLFETRRCDGLFEGYTMNYTQVYIKTDKDVSNCIINVCLDEVMGEGCFGTVQPCGNE
ncbi:MULTISPECIES: tRNA (N(6)-L-threonylcarbamoyladenosine(37)-C(2))-methylthiotransferase MtaB [unclassified Ruminococcus]|uniref:tRNA (N(6)-L-threonylcarbamoyladenosine(37)-C(2))- methylthiotransferase MtaB n=1 Tax=unclassified Ruminococcus TaxID=2608920 RepID=UPI00210B78ED|nr:MULTISPECIES: tRNA (N(6)-L-threonylcarbamoyladenosine(37)-C(2))-methylthiotransferase MtaB [unclassified Ruminococcus]MCQ4021881.1 tRNA (N(6)-L-threonylcarbamoyladenosine(37)-C(2))-methylthiotransferase MtaB [Ruminococcus sp. zg-924]MCQ4114326.1 tRNA (N(6)-L-threonylcarbamoyladenosine(37)-C(2))-methylthiotransferase MtaB [Ruminococcus sp. zg-921]